MNTTQFLQAQQLMSHGFYREACELFCAVRETVDSPADLAAVLFNEATCWENLGDLKNARDAWSRAVAVAPKSEEHQANLQFLDATLCVAEGRNEDAEKKLTQILKRYKGLLELPDYRYLYEEVQLRRGILLVELNNSQAARPILEESAQFKAAQSATFYYHLGVCYFDLNNWPASRTAFTKGLSLDPSQHYQARMHYHLGIVQTKLGASAQARHHFELAAQKAERSDVPLALIYNWFWRLSQEMGLNDDARRFEELERQSLTKWIDNGE